MDETRRGQTSEKMHKNWTLIRHDSHWHGYTETDLTDKDFSFVIIDLSRSSVFFLCLRRMSTHPMDSAAKITAIPPTTLPAIIPTWVWELWPVAETAAAVVLAAWGPTGRSVDDVFEGLAVLAVTVPVVENEVKLMVELGEVLDVDELDELVVLADREVASES